MTKQKSIELQDLSSSSRANLSPPQINKLGLTRQQHEVLNEMFSSYDPIGRAKQRSVIFKCKRRTNDELYAVKIFHLSDANTQNGVPYQIIREISVLKEMDHPNIVKLVDVISSTDDVFIMFECLNGDLRSFMSNSVMFLYPIMIQIFMHQILSAVSYMHARKILHRDLNPENMLMHYKRRVVKIGDFGSARTFDAPIEAFSQNLGTAWYRAPELLLGSANYTTQNDIWSVGCIFGEMCLGNLLFKGASDWEILDNIFTVLGTPTEETWPGLTALCGNNIGILESPRETKSLNSVIKENINEVGLDLLSRLLCLCPSNRISAEAALDHPFFNGL